jgi:DNA modification methylase
LSVLAQLESESVNCCVTSPPYFGLRDYGHKDQIGLEQSPNQYVENMIKVFREVRRVLKDDGTLWLNLGDSYAVGGSGGISQRSALSGFSSDGIKLIKLQAKSRPRKAAEGYKQKDLIGIPWMVAFALRNDGWYLRQDLIWHKPNAMPESVKDRFTRSHEYVFLLSKSKKYYFDQNSVKENARYARPNGKALSPYSQSFGRGGGKKYSNESFYGKQNLVKAGKTNHLKRNKRSVWSVATRPFKGPHFAAFPVELVLPCVLAGCPPMGIVLDPFMGTGTVGYAARATNRDFIGIEINSDYIEMAKRRIKI